MFLLIKGFWCLKAQSNGFIHRPEKELMKNWEIWSQEGDGTCKLPRQCGAPRLEDPRISSVQQGRSSPKEKVCTKRNRTQILWFCFIEREKKSKLFLTHPCPHLFWLNSGMVNATAFHPPEVTLYQLCPIKLDQCWHWRDSYPKKHCFWANV